MINVPVRLRIHLSPVEEPAIEMWWKELEGELQEELIQMYNENEGEEVWVELTARAIGEEPVQPVDEVWVDQVHGLYEFLANKNIGPWDTVRTFHIGGICSAHPKAQQIIRKGELKGDFSCPLADCECPMKRIQSFFPGQGVKFFLRFGTGDSSVNSVA